jgi:hypothetical protein
VLRAVFVRTLKPGVTYEQFRDAWVPDGVGDYPAAVSVSRNVADDRQVITILELDVSLEQFQAMQSSLTRPDALQRLGEIVETTELAAVFEQVLDNASLRD